MAEVKDYFRTFCRLSQAFGTAATQEGLLVLIVQYAIDTMGGKAACLFLELTASLNSSLDIKHILNNMTAEVSNALGMKGSDIRLPIRADWRFRTPASI